MKAKNNTRPLLHRSLLWTSVLLILLLTALYYISGELKYYSLNEEALGRFFGIKWWLVGHLSGGILALVIGPLQFWESFRVRNLKLHRTIGKIYLLAIAVAAFSSTFMAWNTALAIHFTWALSLQVLAVVWITTAFMAYRAIRKKRIRQHREWMIRSYIVTFGFITFRWMNDTLGEAGIGTFVERAPTIVYLLILIPLGVAGLIFEWNKK